MPDQIISTDQTSTVGVASGTTTYVAKDASVLVVGGAGIVQQSGTDQTVIVDGSVVSLSNGGDGIFFSNGSDVVTRSVIEIGTTGRVVSSEGNGVSLNGYGSRLVNDGSVSGGSTGIRFWANLAVTTTAEENPSILINNGSIQGRTGLVIGGISLQVVNNGTITGAGLLYGDSGVGVHIDGYDSQFHNVGDITGGYIGVNVAPFSLRTSLSNDGRIHGGAYGIRLDKDGGSLVNSGAVSSEGTGLYIRNTLPDFAPTLLRVVHSGTVVAGGPGIDIDHDAIDLQASGSVTAGGVGIVLAGPSALVRSTGTIDAGTDGLRVTGDNALITLGGQIEAGGRGVHVTGDAPVIWSDADIVAQGDAGIRIDGLNNASLETYGHVASVTGVGITIDSDDARLVNGGDLSGQYYGVVLTFSGDPLSVSRWNVTNSGDIQGGFGGISSDVGLLNLLNTGTIRALVGAAILTTDPAKVVNRGLIAAGSDGDAVLFGAGVDVLRNSGSINGDVSTGASNDTVRNTGEIDGRVSLGDGNDRFDGRGGRVADTIEGGKGLDTLIGGLSDDVIIGGKSNDSLSGRGGDDTLRGATGKDTMTGGAGADRFVFGLGAEAGTPFNCDVITDFRPGEDGIDLSAFMPGASFIGGAAFQVGFANTIRYDAAQGRILMELTGDAVADFALLLANRPAALTAGDFWVV